MGCEESMYFAWHQFRHTSAKKVPQRPPVPGSVPGSVPGRPGLGAWGLWLERLEYQAPSLKPQAQVWETYSLTVNDCELTTLSLLVIFQEQLTLLPSPSTKTVMTNSVGRPLGATKPVRMLASDPAAKVT